MHHPNRILARETQTLGALCPSGTDQGIETEGLEICKRQLPLLAHTTVAVVIHLRICQDPTELFAQTFLHFMLRGKNAIFCQTASFDIAVEQHHVPASLGQFLRSIQSGWTSPDNPNQMPAICLCVRHT